MNAGMRAPVLLLALIVVAGCGGRQVEVRTAPTTSTTGSARELSVQVTNNLSQAVNISVTPTGGTELFLRQVPANTVERVTVQGVASGTTVIFKAVTVDGSRTYQSRSASLNGMYPWSIP